MSPPLRRRLPVLVLTEDLADGWSAPRPRDLTYVPLPRTETPDRGAAPVAEVGEAA